MSAEEKTIIHFTDAAGAVKGILGEGFKIKYCKESVWFGDVEKRFRVPMVSFCDIPIDQASDHMAKYGRYGLGLTEEWAVRMGMTTVTYLERNSTLAKNKLDALDFAIGQANQDPDDARLMKVLDELRYMKNYSGELWRKGLLCEEKYYFRDEHEWRFSPFNGHFHQFIYMEQMFAKMPELGSMVQQLIDDEKLLFAASDIRYIIIEKEDERADFESHIRGLTERFTEEERESLVTRIFTAEQIKKDSNNHKSS